VKRYADPSATIHAAVGDRFAVELAGNPTTGYSWHVRAGSEHLDLLGQEYEPGGTAAGAGGVEVFRFRALAPGEAEIDFDYRRPWEREVHTSRRFRVAISG
jgi:inhibitor of cysteine peptidase